MAQEGRMLVQPRDPDPHVLAKPVGRIDEPPDLVDSSDSDDEPARTYGLCSDDSDSDDESVSVCGLCSGAWNSRVPCGPRSSNDRNVVAPFTDEQPGVSSSSGSKPHIPNDAAREMAEKGVGEDDNMDLDQGGEEAKVRVPKIPIKPSKQEIEEQKKISATAEKSLEKIKIDKKWVQTLCENR